MTRIDDSQVPGTAELQRKYQSLLRLAEQNQQGRLLALRDTVPKGEGSDKSLNSEEMKLAEACRDFEALFIQQMLKEMRKGLREDSVLGSNAGSLAADRNRNSFFRDQMYQNISEDLANGGGFGIGSVLFDQLYRQEQSQLAATAATAGQSAARGQQLELEHSQSVQHLLREQRQKQQQIPNLSQLQLDNRYAK